MEISAKIQSRFCVSSSWFLSFEGNRDYGHRLATRSFIPWRCRRGHSSKITRRRQYLCCDRYACELVLRDIDSNDGDCIEKNRQTRDVLFIDASREFVKGKNQNKLSEENIQKILETYAERKDVEKYAHLANFDEIKENDYNLNIPRYVDTFEEEEPIDMVHVGNDIKKIRQEQQVLEKELLEAISSLQTTPENEAWLQGALEVFKHE